MFVTGIGTAAPENRFTQRECYEAVEVTELFASLKPRSRAIIKKILLGDNGIETRHFCVKRINETFEMTPDILQSRFMENAPALAASAAERALVDAGCSASEIDAVIISTCTGYLCPGLTSYVAERLGLRPDIFTLDLVGQGCGAAIPNLRTAEALLAGGRAEKVLSICVEVCSAAMYIDGGLIARTPTPRQSEVRTPQRNVAQYSQRGRSFARSQCRWQIVNAIIGKAKPIPTRHHHLDSSRWRQGST